MPQTVPLLPATLPALLLLTAAIMFLTFAGTYIAVKAQKTPLFWGFLLMLGSFLILLTGRFLMAVAPEPNVYLHCILIQLAGVFLLPGGWFLFCHGLAKGSWPRQPVLLIWLAINAAILFLIAANDWHRQFIHPAAANAYQPGPLFPVVHWGLTALEFGGGLGYLWQSRKQSRETSTLTLMAIVLSILGGLGLTLVAPARLTSDLLITANFLLFCMLIWYLGRYVFIDLSPVSLDVFLSNIQDAVLVFDSQGLLIDSNVNTLERVLPMDEIHDVGALINRITAGMTAGDPERLRRIRPGMDGAAELIGLTDGAETVYVNLHASTLYDQSNEPLGLVITMHDISAERRLAEELAQKNRQLEQANTQLLDYLSIATRLEEERERNRIAMEIHHQVGQNMTGLLDMLEAARAENAAARESGMTQLSRTIGQCREVLAKIRVAVTKLLPR